MASLRLSSGWKVGLFILLFVGLILTTVLLFLKNTSLSLASEIAAARKEGLAVELADLKISPLAESDNAAPVYAKAIALYHSEWLSRLHGDTRKDPGHLFISYKAGHMDASRLQQYSAIVAEVQPAMKLAEAAARKPGCDFKFDYMHFGSAAYGMSEGLTNLVGTECVMADLDAARGEPDEALQHLQYADSIAEHAGSGHN